MSPFSPEAEALIEQRKRERMERWQGDRPMFDTARTIGDFRLAEPGAEVWSKTDGDVANVRMNASGEPRGGIVLEVTTDYDQETGETLRAFRCLDYTLGDDMLWRAESVLQEAQIDPQSFTAPDWNRVKRTYRRLCREVGKKVHGRHAATAQELDMVTNAFRLAAILRRTLG